MIPADPIVYRQIPQNGPVILNKQAIVVVLQVDLVVLWRVSADHGDQRDAAVERIIIRKIVYEAEELNLHESRVKSIHLCPQIVPAELEVVVSEQFADIRRERRILLVEIGARARVAEVHRGQIAQENAASICAERHEQTRGAGIRVGRTNVRGLAAICGAERDDGGVPLVADQERIRPGDQQVPRTAVVSCGRQALRRRKR